MCETSSPRLKKLKQATQSVPDFSEACYFGFGIGEQENARQLADKEVPLATGALPFLAGNPILENLPVEHVGHENPAFQALAQTLGNADGANILWCYQATKMRLVQFDERILDAPSSSFGRIALARNVREFGLAAQRRGYAAAR